ncbi:MAG: arylsulfatase A-like enzyme [Pseudohongiellaceae bacterium]|jgi:arylsulfatase A-like enzyme
MPARSAASQRPFRAHVRSPLSSLSQGLRRLAGSTAVLLSISCSDSATVPEAPAASGPVTVSPAPGASRRSDNGSSWIQLSGFSSRPRRVVSPSLASDGFALASGRSVALDVTVDFPGVLRFSVALRPENQEQVNELPQVLNVLWDGQLLDIGALPPDSFAATLHDIVLPGTVAGDSSSHTLEFSVPPGLGHVLVHGPAIRPAHSELRLPDPQRPDVIMFVADTFRADDLDHPGLTPQLDAFAKTAQRFTQARSPSTWTLPSVASLLYGVHPGQHGGVDRSRHPSSPAATLAETFAAAGYRTVAVTDSAFVSRRYGLDRGFEWFQELHQGSLPTTLEVAEQLLDADDGRPLLLMVHSYHTHTPYLPSDATRAALQEQLGIPKGQHDFLWFEAALAKLEADAMALGKKTDDIDTRAAALAPSLANLRLATVRELDTSFGQLLELLEERSLADDAIILFTSDHGDAFHEHGFFFHGRTVFDELLRVPLIVRAPSLEPALVAAPVSLVDIAPTLTQLAGLSVDPLWSGPSLIDPQPGRYVYSFNWPDADSAPMMSVVANSLKIMAKSDPEALATGQVISVFDLLKDPGEKHNLAAEQQERLAQWVIDLAPRVNGLLTPLSEQTQAVELDAQQMEQLRQLGYIGEDQ